MKKFKVHTYFGLFYNSKSETKTIFVDAASKVEAMKAASPSTTGRRTP